ncbi:MAG: tripartite tricarboxylate transporter substrate binding protein [Rhodocyclaceae bacterium]|jgi:tripartite-type tricarboxylate transporter receptor subunit TctC|nr:tripartite tricarboxylate transporter substrate binding protein [Rhodocyclaceae bacterium]MCA3075309.1 tripartite tricarboxylate transporter substrate binding protein [Rhodocyclaceae bacterium]MCA3089215.1 tripartite tricarboxylate transporter substrate binding protein [Rhodocyclaceae bacterium]MCA3092776.1 tripartite tricarboxylate transporter substrate binding protein [Rhodocyclaceae bacterium]MCA3097133.1 tripartite tricarboxylate transporter substrate binding protein [Rhodocyclaceae bact
MRPTQSHQACPALAPATILATALALSILPPPATAQAFPTMPVRIVVPFPPGGGTDILARLIAARMTESFGQPVLVDNRGGANGTIGAALVARATPDGHTLLVVPSGFAANPALYPALPYSNDRDFAPVSQLAASPLVLVVHPSLPARSVKELVTLAQKQPGRLDYATAGSGSPPHLATEYFKLLARVQIVHIPYKGAGPAGADVLAGQVPIYFMNLLQAMPLIRSNRLRALGVTTPKRFGALPDVPTIAEGGIDGYQFTNWYGALAPAGVPRDILARLQGEIARILNTQEVRTRLAGEGAEVVASNPEQFSAFLKAETAKFERIIREARIRATD